MRPKLGDQVHFVMADGTVRPAFVVAVWSDTCANLRVLFDGSNDAQDPSYSERDWVTSVEFSQNDHRPRTFHYPALPPLRPAHLSGTLAPTEQTITLKVEIDGDVLGKELAHLASIIEHRSHEPAPPTAL